MTNIYGEISANASCDYYNNGYNESVEITANKTLSSTDCGKVQDVAASATITLPTSAAGLSYKIRIANPGETINIVPQSADTINGFGFTAAANKGLHFTNANAGAHVELTAGGGNQWYISSMDLAGSAQSVLTYS